MTEKWAGSSIESEEVTLGHSIVNKQTNRKLKQILQMVWHEMSSLADVPESSNT